VGNNGRYDKDPDWRFERHAEALAKSTALYIELRQLLNHAPISAMNNDRDAKRSFNRFRAAEFCADYENAIKNAKKLAQFSPHLWTHYLRYLLTVAELVEHKIPAGHWRDLVRTFGKVLYASYLHPGNYFRTIKRRTIG
jgi:hypothetical protein